MSWESIEDLEEFLEKRGAEIQTVGNQPYEKKPNEAPRVKKKKKTKQGVDYTPKILEELGYLGIPEPTLEYVFHDERKWRFDMAWVPYKVSFEIEGGIWLKTSGGYGKGHAHPTRVMEDIEKYTEAQLYGWIVVRGAPKHINSGIIYDWIARALELRGWVKGEEK